MDNSNSTFLIDGSKGAIKIAGYNYSYYGGNDPGGSITGGAVEIASAQTVVLSGVLSTALTVDANATLTGMPTYTNGYGGGPITIAGPSLVNRGNIGCTNGSIVINSDTFTNSGAMNVSGGYLNYIQINSANWNNSGSIITGQNQSTALSGNWSNTGIITAQTLDLGGTFTTASLTGIHSDKTQISGTMSNTHATFMVNGSLGNLSISGTVNGGAVDVSAGQRLNVGGIISQATVTVDAGATFAGIAQGPSFINHGTIEGRATAISSDMFFNDGTINAVGGNFTFSNTLDVGQGILRVGGGVDPGFGYVYGGGTITTPTLILDNDPSTLLVDLAFAQQSGLDVTGNVILGGNLEIEFLNGFDQNVDSTYVFDALTVDSGYSMTGSFLNVPSGGRLETADGLGSFEVDYGGSANANEVVLSNFQAGAIPEPTCLSLPVIALIGLGRRSRKTVIFS